MALTNADYRLVLTGYLDDDFDNPFQSQFWYKADGDGSAQQLATNFGLQVVPEICNIISSRLQFATIDVVNLVDLQDFTTYTISDVGTRGINLSNKWDAWAFRYLRPIRGINNGSKRFGPIYSGDYSDTGPASGMLVTLDLLSDTLESPLPTIGGASYSPCCVKTEKVANENGNGKFHYEPIDLFICNSVSFVKVSHQDSRG